MKITIILLIVLAWNYDHTAHASTRTVRILNRTLKPFPIDYEAIRRANELKREEEFLQTLQTSISDEDLLRVSEEMFNADDNNAFKKITVHIQGNTTFFSRKDEAPNNLLIIPRSIWQGPTVAPLVALFDNYHLDYTQPETETPKERKEQTTYINAILATRPMKILTNFLVNKGVTYLKDRQDQVKFLKKIWFTKYSRHWTNYIKCSCAFEYTFMSEAVRCWDKGLHSWIYFAKRETAVNNTANYLGYLDKLDLAGKGIILKYNAMMGAKNRHSRSIVAFIGTSPELETALYTLCFMARPNLPCKLRYNNVSFAVKTKTLRIDNVRLIDTAFPLL